MRFNVLCVASLVLLGALAWQARGQEDEQEVYSSALLEVKNFIHNHLPDYPDVDVKYVGGRDPEMLFMNESGEVVKRVSVVDMDEEGINQLLNSHGFFKEAPETESETESEPESTTEETKEEL